MNSSKLILQLEFKNPTSLIPNRLPDLGKLSEWRGGADRWWGRARRSACSSRRRGRTRGPPAVRPRSSTCASSASASPLPLRRRRDQEVRPSRSGLNMGAGGIQAEAIERWRRRQRLEEGSQPSPPRRRKKGPSAPRGREEEELSAAAAGGVRSIGSGVELPVFCAECWPCLTWNLIISLSGCLSFPDTTSVKKKLKHFFKKNKSSKTVPC